VRAGAALDPELFMFGVHTQIGPIFSRNVFFRPNAEFAFAEVTDLIALNLEAIYRLPITARGKTWSAYFGAASGSRVHLQYATSPKVIDSRGYRIR
jgi:hypothetical protein